MYPDCLELVIRNYDKILHVVKEFLKLRGLRYKELYLYGSRVTGTCRPHSDIDIYVQLTEEHRGLVEGGGVPRELLLQGVDRKKFEESMAIEPPVYIDIKAGISEKPPYKPRYKNMKYYMKLSDLAQHKPGV